MTSTTTVRLRGVQYVSYDEATGLADIQLTSQPLAAVDTATLIRVLPDFQDAVYKLLEKQVLLDSILP
jgi:hypothetical protein